MAYCLKLEKLTVSYHLDFSTFALPAALLGTPGGGHEWKKPRRRHDLRCKIKQPQLIRDMRHRPRQRHWRFRHRGWFDFDIIPQVRDSNDLDIAKMLSR
jgi:hypothetical protein